MAQPHKFKTTGDIAKQLGIPMHKLYHILNTRAHIKPLATGGGYRLYDDDAVDAIKHELDLIDEKKKDTQ